MSPLLARQILGLQATAGNLAVQRLLQPALPATSKRNAAATLQRKVAVKEAKPGGGPVGRARDIESDMRDVLKDWKAASVEGVNQFVGQVLSERIDKIESGSWKSYLTSMLGNTIWAAACFLDPAMALLVFGVAMSGIAIGSIPGIPSPTKSSLPAVEKAMLDYLDTIYLGLNGQLPKASDQLAARSKHMSRFEAIAHFIEASFKPEMRYEYKPYGALPQVNQTAIRNEMFHKAMYEFDAAEKVEPAIAASTGDYAKLGYSVPGMDKGRRTVAGGMIILKDKTEGVIHRYAARARVDIAHPGDNIFNEREGSLPPTTYFYHWLSHALLNAEGADARALGDRIKEEINKVPSAMYEGLNDQKERRRVLVEKVQDKIGKKPTESLLRSFRSMSGETGEVGNPVTPELYETAVLPVYRSIIDQLDDLGNQIAHLNSPKEQRQKAIKDLIVFDDGQ